MSHFTITFISDVLLAMLLIITITYCWRLQRRLRDIQNSRGELAKLMKLFDESTERATKGIADLQTLSKKVTESLSGRMDKAGIVADDLHFLIDKATKLSEQLEKKVAVMQHNQQVISELEKYNAKPFKAAEQKPAYQPPVQSGMRATLQNKVAGMDNQTKAPSSLESLLEKISIRPETTQAQDVKTPANTNMQFRTQAERELYEALKRK